MHSASTLFSTSLLGLLLLPLNSVLAFEDEAALQATQAGEPASDGRVLSALVDALGSDDFATRRQAFFDIRSLGRSALPGVQQAAESSNLQVAQAAKALVPLLLLELTDADLGSDVYALLLKPSMAGVVTLCQRGNWDLAVELVRSNRELGAEDMSFGYRMAQLVSIAQEQDDPKLAWPLIRSLLRLRPNPSSGSDLAAFIAFKLDLDLGDEASEDERALLLAFDGQVEQALEMEVSDRLRRKLLIREAQWPSLERQENVKLLLGARVSLANRAAQASLLDLAGNTQASQAIWNQLLARPKDGAGAEGAEAESTSKLDAEELAALQLLRDAPGFETNQLLFSLLIAGHVRAVEEFLLETKSESTLGFLLSNNRYGLAFEHVGLKRDLSNFDSWLELKQQALDSEVAQQFRGMKTFDELARICRTMISLGFDGQAETLLDRLVATADDQANIWRYTILRYLQRSEQRQVLLKVLEKHIDDLRTETKRSIFMVLFPEFANSVVVLEDTLPRLVANGRSPHLLEVLDRLHAWDESYFAAYGTSISFWLGRAERRLLERSKVDATVQYAGAISELIDIARGAGFDELATSFASSAVDNTSVQTQWVDAAEIAFEEGRLQDAADWLARFRRAASIYSFPIPTMLEERALLMLGKYDQALALNQSRWLRPLALVRYREGTAYATVADDLFEEGAYKAAEEYARIAFLLSDASSNEFYYGAGDLSRIHEEQENFQASADVLRAVAVEGLVPGAAFVADHVTNGSLGYFLYTLPKERLHRAVALIEAGKFKEAQSQIDLGRRMQPQDIEMVVQCYPRLQQSGQTDAAEEMFALYEKTMREQLKAWPRDATTLNNLAWMYAKTQRNLDQALELSKRAVALAPSSAVYLDTLAEVHFQAGRFASAEAAMNQCIRIDPRDKHYRENLLRFKEAQ